MPTQGPTPGLKCKLIISSFLILRHLLDCLICTRNTISLVFLLQMMGGCDRYSMGNQYYGARGRL